MSVFADREWPRVDGGQQQTCAMYKPRHVCPCAFFCGCNCGGSRATSCWRPTINISCLNQSKERAYAHFCCPKREAASERALAAGECLGQQSDRLLEVQLQALNLWLLLSCGVWRNRQGQTGCRFCEGVLARGGCFSGGGGRMCHHCHCHCHCHHGLVPLPRSHITPAECSPVPHTSKCNS
jgi:hypothetical protein